MKIKITRTHKIIGVVTLIAVIFAVGYYLGTTGKPEIEQKVVVDEATEEEIIWTCSMHPQIRQSEPGQCPICGMDLIPLTMDKDEELKPRQMKLSKTAEKLAQVVVTPVERKAVTHEVRMVGKVDYDETRLSYITAWVPGRLDRLYVDYTGIPVQEGDHMVSIYSPDILTAQEELLQAIATVKKLEGSSGGIVRDTAEATVRAAREKLRLWGLTQEQIKKIEQDEEPSDHITIYAPASGIVVHKNAVEGMYVQTGTRIYTVADLSTVWVKLDAYESDLNWITYGQEVSFTTQAYPGHVFNGKVAFIDPVLDQKTRTVKVRLNVPNEDGMLKPEMFVRAILRAEVSAQGKVINADLAGKWIGPMHPEIVQDEPGNCPICGMPLVKAESLGFVGREEGETRAPLVIPASAPLLTGKRAVVYVKVPDKDGVYEGKEIVLGPRAGDYYIVKEGLKAGELVVTNGNFKIDSAVQILAKPSMMNPAGGVTATGHHNHQAPAQQAETPAEVSEPAETVSLEFRRQLGAVVEQYFSIQTALASDDLAAAKKGAKDLREKLDLVDMELVSGKAHVTWMKNAQEMEQTADTILNAENLEDAREGFAMLSQVITTTIDRFGAGPGQNVYQAHCPMAFGNRGASWLQSSKEISNPYFGNMMPRCGEITKKLAGE